MKHSLTFAILMLGALLFACKESSNPAGPNDLGGETDIPLTKVGNQYAASIQLGSSYLDTKDSVMITKNDNGFVTVHVMADLSQYPDLLALIPAAGKDSLGHVNTDVHFKVTSEGIQNYSYSNYDYSKPFTIVKYNSNVGDTYEFTKADGTKIIRTVTAKSTVDDWPMGFLLIKTMTTEEVPAIAGVSKITYRTNHKFGLVYVEYQLTDGRIVKLWLLPLANL